MIRILAAALLALATAPLALGAGSPATSRSPARDEPAHLRYYNDAINAERGGDLVRAVQMYRRSIKEKGDFADARNNLGFALRKIAGQQLDEAMAEYVAALRIEPAHEGALEYQGELFLQRGELRKAMENVRALERIGSPEAAKLKALVDKVVAEAQSL